MARRDYLSDQERLRFDSPPQLSSLERLILLDLPQWAEKYLDQVHTPTNKVGFILQLGYFRIVTRFFVPDRFPAADLEWVAGQLKFDPLAINLQAYTHNRSLYRHRTVILDCLGFGAFGEVHRTLLLEEAQRLSHLQTRPARILDAMVSFLRERRVELPPYNTMREIITQALDAFEAHLLEMMTQHLTPAHQALLDSLLDNSDKTDKTSALTVSRYPLTDMKQITQSMQPQSIAQRVALFEQLKSFFTQLAPLIAHLELVDDTIRYYAQYVLDTPTSQLADRVHEKYLRLLAFIAHQYLCVGDALILTLKKAVASTLQDCENRLKEAYYQNKQATANLVGQVSRQADLHIDALHEIEQIVEKSAWNSDQKVDSIRQILNKKKLTTQQLQADKQRVLELKAINQPIQEQSDYYDALEKASTRLGLRVSAIVQTLNFDADTSDTYLLQAIIYYQQNLGKLTQPAQVPLEFLSMAQRQHVFTEKGKLRVALYKVLLFEAIRDGLRKGTLTVLSSYEYRSMEEYQIPREQWQLHREHFLQKANMLDHANPAAILLALNQQLNQQYERTNTRLADNEQVFFDAQGGWHLHRYRSEQQEVEEATRLLYPSSRVISLREVMLQIDNLTSFLGKFHHQSSPQKPTRPDNRLLMAAIIGYGENIGIRKMGLISKNISVNTLETVATQYFSPEMLLEVNDFIVSYSNALPLTDLFRRKEGFIMTGSDGQKYDVSVPSLRASASYKYFGNGEGVSVYSGLDEAGQLVYTVVINAADRESSYVLDVVLHNQVIQPNAHSTDMHGVSEINFAVMGLLGIDFRPRLVKMHRQQLFSIDALTHYRQKGYKMVPVERINYEHLVAYWDDVLRFNASMKLGYVLPSMLLKRLNSYASEHPLHKALSDLGRLYKSDLVLRVVDDPALRASIEGMLTKVEHSNKFGNAVMLGNGGDLVWSTERERNISGSCRMLIMNLINLFNLLYLSEKLRQCKTETDREDLLKTILKSSTHTWHHINLAGEYDFSGILYNWYNTFVQGSQLTNY